MFEFARPQMLAIAYGANIAMLLPVCAALWLGGGTVAIFGTGVADSPALAALVRAFWTAILLMSAAALLAPPAFWPMLAIQLLYKAIWLAGYAAPRWWAGHGDVPKGVTISFVAICAVILVALALARPRLA